MEIYRQRIKLYFEVMENREFAPEEYDTANKFMVDIIAKFIDCCEHGDSVIVDEMILDDDVNDTMLLTNTWYYFEFEVKYASNTMPSMNDTGEITTYDKSKLLEVLPELSDIDVKIETPTN